MKPDKAKVAAKIEGMKVLNADQKKEVRELVEELIGEKLPQKKPIPRIGMIYRSGGLVYMLQDCGYQKGYVAACLSQGYEGCYPGGSENSEEETISKLGPDTEFISKNLTEYLKANGGKV